MSNNIENENCWTHDHIQKVCEGLHRLQQNRTFCDITIKVGDTSFEAHKAVLASNSDFFHSMFTSGFQESHASVATITGKPAAFQILLDFSYSGKLDVHTNETTAVMDVLKMAHYLQYNLVVVRCEEVLLQIFPQYTIKDVLQMISDSDVFGLVKLKTRCQQYLAQNFKESGEFLQCMTSELIVETLNHKDFNVTDEKKVFDIIVAWLKHDWEGRKEFAVLLLQKVRLGAIPVGHLTVTFLETPELNSIPECRQMVVRVMQLFDNKKPDDPPLSLSHPALFGQRSMITAIICLRVYNSFGRRLHPRCLFFDTKNLEWTSLTKLPPFREMTEPDNCVVAHSQLYIARKREDPMMDTGPQFLSLDLVNMKWVPLAPMKYGWEGCCLVPLGQNHIYVISRPCNEDSSKECEVYIINDNRWRVIAPMPPGPRPVCKLGPNSAVAYEGNILVYGEDNRMEGGHSTNDMYHLMMYNPTFNTWQVLGTFDYGTNRVGFTSGLVVQNGRCYRSVGFDNAGFIVHEIIIDNINRTYTCTSGSDQRQSQDAIPSRLTKKAFCIDQNVYVFYEGGYHKQGLKVPPVGWLENMLPNMFNLAAGTTCATTFTFDKTLLV
ncbi:kelch-like protein 7 [Amphiura filiformis]|uniref:kelch-like protein 7 n=1 Tax=Amphiura filiformis TaxID=82378 RepID=UPI003B221F3C